MDYTLQKEDLEKCIKFAVDLYLYSKGSPNRITGESRSLGAMIDSWVSGKAIEIGVKSVLEELGGRQKRLLLDFSVGAKNRSKSEPDITAVEENGKERGPKLHVEIKNYSPKERWLGLRMEQFNTIKKRIGDAEKAFLIYASLIDGAEKDKRLDLLGSFLQIASKDEYKRLFEEFVAIGDIKVKVEFAFSLSDLEKYGAKFCKGKDKVYETDIFQEAKAKPKGLEEMALIDGALPKPKDAPDRLSKLVLVEGGVKVYKKRNKRRDVIFVEAVEDSVVENEVLGSYRLQSGRLYKLDFREVGRNPQVYMDALWISKNKAGMFAEAEKLEDTLKFIIENI